MGVSRLRQCISGILIGLGLLWVLPAQAQVSDGQVGALVEALRRAAPQTGNQNDGLYSDWQVLPANIPRWSRSCIGRELTPAQFEASPATARSVLVCVMRDVLREQSRMGGNESVAVRRAAAWWMTGDPNRYNNAETGSYTQRVLRFYQQARAGSPAQRPSPPRPQPAAPAPRPTATVAPDLSGGKR